MTAYGQLSGVERSEAPPRNWRSIVFFRGEHKRGWLRAFAPKRERLTEQDVSSSLEICDEAGPIERIGKEMLTALGENSSGNFVASMAWGIRQHLGWRAPQQPNTGFS